LNTCSNNFGGFLDESDDHIQTEEDQTSTHHPAAFDDYNEEASVPLQMDAYRALITKHARQSIQTPPKQVNQQTERASSDQSERTK
jgi:hypothetical protein